MTSPTVELLGAQSPNDLWVPPAVSSAGAEAVELARMAGLRLDPWQELVLEHSLGEDPAGRWAAPEVGLLVPRQNGKGSVLEARELAGLFLLGERLITHSAHQFDTSLEAFRRLLELIEANPDFSRRAKRPKWSHGEEGLELIGGQRIRFRTRTKGGGRGFSGDLLILDEAMILPESTLGALLPTISARPNPQVWYVGSAVDQLVHEHGQVFARVRARGRAGGDPRLAYFGWEGADCSIEEAEHVADDPETWAQANPGLGIRISLEHIAGERRALGPRQFAAERLGIGDWPDPDPGTDGHFDVQAWRARTDPQSKIVGPVAFAYDISPDRSSSAIAAAGRRADGRLHLEVIDHRRGTGWVTDRLRSLVDAHETAGIACDASGPAGSLLTKLETLSVDVQAVNAREHAQACGNLHDAVTDDTVRHLGTPELESAVQGAGRRSLGDAWAWSRTSSTVDITPLVAVTLAAWALETMPSPSREPMVAWR